MSFTLMTGILSFTLLLSVLPYHEMYSLLPPDLVSMVELYVPVPHSSLDSLITSTQEFAPWLSRAVVTSTLLGSGVVVHLCELAYARTSSSFVNLLLWILLMSLTKVPVKVGGLVTIAHVSCGSLICC